MGGRERRRAGGRPGSGLTARLHDPGMGDEAGQSFRAKPGTPMAGARKRVSEDIPALGGRIRNIPDMYANMVHFLIGHQGRGETFSGPVTNDRRPDLRLRRHHVPVHHIAEHASDRETLRILLGDEPGDPFRDVQRGERVPRALTYDVETLALVGQVALAHPVHNERHVDPSLAVRHTVGRESERLVLELQPVEQAPGSSVVDENDLLVRKAEEFTSEMVDLLESRPLILSKVERSFRGLDHPIDQGNQCVLGRLGPFALRHVVR